MTAIQFIIPMEPEPQMYWHEVAQWPTSEELPADGTKDALLDAWIYIARELQSRGRE